MIKKYLKFCNLISQACGAFAVAALGLSIVIIVELVLERYFFQRAITWQNELVTMLLVASTFIGSAYVLSEKAHVSMEWIYDFLSKKNIIKVKYNSEKTNLIEIEKAIALSGFKANDLEPTNEAYESLDYCCKKK